MRLFTFNTQAMKSKLALHILKLLCIPIIIVTIFAFTGNFYYVNNYKSLLNEFYAHEMTLFIDSVSDEFTKLLDTGHSLVLDPNVNYAITANDLTEIAPGLQIQKAQLTLRNAQSRNEILDNIFIINFNSNTIISTVGMYDSDAFLKEIYSYEKYDYNFWNNTNSEKNVIHILDYTNVSNNYKENYTVVPAVFKPGNSDNIIVFNISLANLFNKFSQYKFTENTLHYIISNDGLNYLTNGKHPLYLKSSNNSSGLNYDTEDAVINSKRYLTFSSPQHINLFGYRFVTAIPYSDIYASSTQTTAGLTVLFVLIILILLLIAYFTSIRLSFPWNALAKNFKTDGTESNYNDDIINYVNQSVQNLLDTNDQLSHSLAATLPLSQQKFLTDLLNTPTSTPDYDIYNTIFKYNYFASVAVNISSRDDSFVLTPNLYKSIYDAVQSVFADNFLTFRLPGSNNSLYLLLNLEDNTHNNKLNSIIESVKKLFAHDMDHINLNIGAGNIYKGLDGLRITHQEALSNIINEMNSDRILISNKLMQEYSLINNIENTLFNYIMANYNEKTIEFLETTFKIHSKDSETYKQLLYSQIFSAFCKAIEVKNQKVPDFNDETKEEFKEQLFSKDEQDILDYFKFLAGILTSDDASPTLKADISTIMKYIQEHYTEDLSLEFLAQHYHMSSTYLSKYLKKHIGLSFKEYVTQLRIDRAKELLVKNPDMSIEQIGKSLGLFSPSAFTKMFKKSMGISPREYRALYSKK